MVVIQMKTKIITIVILLSLFILFVRSKTKHDVNESWNHLRQFGPQMAFEYNLTYLSGGTASPVDQKVIWILTFKSGEPKEISEARRQILELIDALWKEGSTDPVYAKYIVEYEKFLFRDKLTLSLKDFGIRVGYWDENVERFPKPYISQVAMMGEKIQYFYANPETQALEAPITETIEEAKSKLTID